MKELTFIVALCAQQQLVTSIESSTSFLSRTVQRFVKYTIELIVCRQQSVSPLLARPLNSLIAINFFSVTTGEKGFDCLTRCKQLRKSSCCMGACSFLQGCSLIRFARETIQLHYRINCMNLWDASDLLHNIALVSHWY